MTVLAEFRKLHVRYRRMNLRVMHDVCADSAGKIYFTQKNTNIRQNLQIKYVFQTFPLLAEYQCTKIPTSSIQLNSAFFRRYLRKLNNFSSSSRFTRSTTAMAEPLGATDALKVPEDGRAGPATLSAC